MRNLMVFVVLSGVCTSFCGVTAAAAKPARCFTTDDGFLACKFTRLDDAGSFRIEAPEVPIFTLWIDEPGIASGVAQFGENAPGVPLPGSYRREVDDPACWANEETLTKICAW